MSVESPDKAPSPISHTVRDAVVAPGWQSIADLPVGLAVFDRDMRYIGASRRWLADNGIAGRDVVGVSHYDLFPDLPERWKEAHRRALAGETISAENARFERADGSCLWKNWECRPWYDASGIVGGIQIWAEDVTAREDAEELVRQRMLEIGAGKQAEEVLQSELTNTTQMLEYTGAIAKVGGWDLDVPSMQLHWTRETFRIHEIEPPVVPPIADAINFYAPEARPVIQSLVGIALRDGTPYDVELPFITAKGRRIWVRAQCEAEMKDGKVVLLRGAFHDITAKKQAEERQAESHALLVNLAQMVPSAIYQYRLYPDGRSAFPYANPGIAEIYEVTPEEVREDATAVFGRLHPEDAERVSRLIMESARTLEEFYCEFRVILPRQGLRWRWSQAHPERTDDGGTLWHGIISDITERKKAENEKRQLEAQLAQAQKLESVGLLAGGVAHDFNNMLSVILGTVELAIAEVDAKQPLHADLHEIRTAAVRSAELTRQLLGFARQQPIAPTVLDLNETVDGMLAMLRRLIGEDVRIVWEPGAALWPVRMDASQVSQILTNLCINARHAMVGVGTLHIATANVALDATFCAAHAEAVPGDHVRLTVSDTGSGMDAATLARIFEPFFTTKAAGAGTGLGLAMVHGAVKQNEGFIAVASTPGVGTSFEIFLPRHRGPSSSTRSDDAVAADLRGIETILVVEDEPALIRLAARALEALGYVVLTATDTADALRIASTHAGEIHLLLSDVVMPKMNGRDLAVAIQKVRPTIKLLFMSGHTAGIIASRGLLEPKLALIEKPFTPAALAAKVREVLDQE